jgi:hypothetical protein
MNLSLIEPDVKAKILGRIKNLKAGSPPLWGKMTVAQMCAHCNAQMRVALGIDKLKPNWIGKLFGSWMKKMVLSEKPYSHSLPTAPALRVSHEPEFESVRQGMIQLVEKFTSDTIMKDPHPVFGPMSIDEWSRSTWKHLDHHLKQFGV